MRTMLVQALLCFLPLVSASPTPSKWTPGDTSGSDALAEQGLKNLAKLRSGSDDESGTCSLKNAVTRREWHSLTREERRSYVAAVKCLLSKPSQFTDIAGAKNRNDDFVVVHLQQTLTIHGTGNFFAWHRYYTWAYEQALRNECGYQGYQPYLNWGKVALDPLSAPLFDGSDSSISGDGSFRNLTSIIIGSSRPDSPGFVIPAGKGGGCITSGPFKDTQVHLGPVAGTIEAEPPNPSPDGLGFNPRCIRRDINPYLGRTELQDVNTTSAILNSDSALAFLRGIDPDLAAGRVGIHAAGHYVVGGDPSGDQYISPSDPYFYLHHAQMDRVWWIWQNQDVERREAEMGGTVTFGNVPPSRNATSNDPVELGPLGQAYPLGELMSTTKGPFCYIYA